MSAARRRVLGVGIDSKAGVAGQVTAAADTVVTDLVLLPHTDLHLALNAPSPLTLRVFARTPATGNPKRYTLTPVPPQNCVFEFMAPFADVGSRFVDVPTVDPNTGVVTAATPGVYLFQIRVARQYIVGRLQVHRQVLDWWFGNDSITTARDDVAHAQPTIYARFSDDTNEADLVGDITGHQYFPLTPSDNTKILTTVDGRIRGVAITDPTKPLPTVAGTFLAKTQPLSVRVVDYALGPRRSLFPVQVFTLDQADQAHNIVFVAEGFDVSEEELFNEAVTKITHDMFDKPRHQPYGLLEGRFNVFKAFAGSADRSLTCGFQVTDAGDGRVGRGLPIPWDQQISDDPGVYVLKELVERVGLPPRGATGGRDGLVRLWNRQGLDVTASKVDKTLTDEWLVHRSRTSLVARDTLFGLYYGSRLADGTSSFVDTDEEIAVRPAADDGTDEVRAFVRRVYEFYLTFPATRLTPDPRRHPPEIYLPGPLNTNAGLSLLAYLGTLQYTFAPFTPVGLTWVPDDTTFKPSRGLVVVLARDNLFGGANTDNSTFTSLSLDNSRTVAFTDDKDNPLRRQRDAPDVEPNRGYLVDVAAHELGHSFNLLDENEVQGGDEPTDDADPTDFAGDNVTRLSFLRLNPAPDRRFEPGRVKWFEPLRARVSERLVAPSSTVAGGLQIAIDPTHISQWVRAKERNADVYLRNVRLGAPTGQQFPLAFTEDQYLPALRIVSLNEKAGLLVLAGGALPVPPFPVFATGSLLFVPKVDKNTVLLHLAQPGVLSFLGTTRLPLNKNTDFTTASEVDDHPVDIDGVRNPCKSERLIGIYEGAVHVAGGRYRPAGACKMRDQHSGEFCFVCKWLIVNRVDPGLHSILDRLYYPEASCA